MMKGIPTNFAYFSFSKMTLKLWKFWTKQNEIFQLPSCYWEHQPWSFERWRIIKYVCALWFRIGLYSLTLHIFNVWKTLKVYINQLCFIEPLLAILDHFLFTGCSIFIVKSVIFARIWKSNCKTVDRHFLKISDSSEWLNLFFVGINWKVVQFILSFKNNGMPFQSYEYIICFVCYDFLNGNIRLLLASDIDVLTIVGFFV